MIYQLSAFADEASPNLAGQINALNRNNIRLIELRSVDGVNCSNLTNEQAQNIYKQLSDNGIGVWSLGSPFGKYKATDDFAPHFEAFKRGLELCHILGTERMRMFSFYTDDKARDRQAVMERLAAFIELAKQEGILLCHENEKGIYGDDLNGVADIINTLGNSMEIVYDPANYIQVGQSVKDAYDYLESYVDYFHIKDALYKDGSVVPAGYGDGNIKWMLDDFVRRDSVLSVEPHLKVFDGLNNLQTEAVKNTFEYPSNDAAFDAAVTALKNILTEIGFVEMEAGTWRR